MEIKGSSLKSTNDFVKENFPDRYSEWLENLPQESKILFSDIILITDWYPPQEGLVIPTKTIAKLFYNNNESLASFEIGKFSAKTGLTGIYNLFIKIASPSFILKRASSMFTTYYSHTNFDIIESDKSMAKMQISGFKIDEILIFDRTEGWTNQLGDIINVKFNISKKVEIIGNNANCIILSKW